MHLNNAQIATLEGIYIDSVRLSIVSAVGGSTGLVDDTTEAGRMAQWCSLWARIGLSHLGAFVLGWLSISTASLALLIGLFVGQVLEMAIAGAVVGSGLAGMRLQRLFGVVIVFVLLSVITVIVLQSLGVVPSTRLSS